MKRAKYGAKKIRDFEPVFTPHFHANPKRLKNQAFPAATGSRFAAKRGTAMP